MTRFKTTLATCGVLATGLVAFLACNSVNSPAVNGVDSTPVDASQGRKNAERLIDNGGANKFLIDLLQFTPGGGHARCRPLGGGGFVPWNSRFGGPILIQPFKYNVIGASAQGIASEYDDLTTIGETGFCLGLRTPVEPVFPNYFSQVEFNIRAVNPWAFGHAPGFPYVNTVDGNQASYPSNDDVVPNRSLIDINGGDVAIVVAGINFAGAPTSTFAAMNFLGPTGWVLFFRDNAFQSGRFYNLAGALKGGPRAFEDTPPAGDEGSFESAQVNGDNFDANSTLLAGNTYFPPFDIALGSCPGPADPAPYPKAYTFSDLSNIDELGAPKPGEGGFILVIRRQAFNSRGVVVNPNVPGPAPAFILPGDILNPPPGSGYNEPAVLPITGPDEDNFLPTVPGVHEIGFSAFFTHSF